MNAEQVDYQNEMAHRLSKAGALHIRSNAEKRTLSTAFPMQATATKELLQQGGFRENQIQTTPNDIGGTDVVINIDEIVPLKEENGNGDDDNDAA